MKQKLKVFYNFILGMFYFARFYVLDLPKIKKSNVVLFFPYYHTGGAEKVHLDVVKALKHQRLCVVFTHASATNNFYSEFRRYAQLIEINLIRNKKSRFISSLLKDSITKSINSSKSVQAVFGSNTSFFYSILQQINERLKRIDLIHALSENDERMEVFAQTSQMIEHRICISQKGKNDLILGYKIENIPLKANERLMVILNGVKTNVTQTGATPKMSFGYIGRWSDEKRPKIFLEVAKKVKAIYPKADFIMAGRGMKQNLHQIESSGVKFLGEITCQKELNEIYKSLTAVVICSVYEGFPMVLMESMVYGCVPVCTNVGGINEHITNMENGILIDADNEKLTDAFTQAICYLIENPHFSKKLSESALHYSLQNFSIEKFNTAYQKLIG